MTVHPQIAEVLANLPAPSPGPLNPVAMRAGEAEQVAPVEERLPIASVRDSIARTASGQVPVRVYTDSSESSGNGGNGVLVYFHGGAFFLGSLDTHDHVCRFLAKETGFTVVSVGFRLAPENAYPAGLDDCYGVVRWVAEAAGTAETGWDGHRLAIAGDSSGGTFVAAVAAKALDDAFERISHQILYYPSLDLDFEQSRYASLTENATGYGLETPRLKPFNAFYIDSGADPADPLVSPIKRESLVGLPKALIVTAGYDPLRDEGELYGERLRTAGVDATVIRYEHANHGFVQNFSWIPEFRQVYRDTAEFLGRG